MKMGHGTVTEELDIILLCKKMSWTYTQYMEQPYWFIASLSEMVRMDTKEGNRKIKKANTKYGS